MLNPTELYNLKGLILWHVNYASIFLMFLKYIACPYHLSIISLSEQRKNGVLWVGQQSNSSPVPKLC